MSINKEKRRLKIRKSIRAKISGTKERPRVSVFKSNKAVYAQIIDDMSGNTMVSCSSVEIKKFGKNNVESSKEVGLKLAEKPNLLPPFTTLATLWIETTFSFNSKSLAFILLIILKKLILPLLHLLQKT